MTPASPVFPSLGKINEVEIAKDQPQYLTLPAWRSCGGVVVTRWRLTWRERLQILCGGNLWLTILTFNEPLQPVRLAAKEPTPEAEALAAYGS